MDENLESYRTFLVNAEKKAQEDFDKTILTLSGGALGVSLAFVKDIIGPNPIQIAWVLLLSWGFWITSLTSILISFYTSQKALRKTVLQIDSNDIYGKVPGGFLSKITSALNLLGMLFFIFGIISIVVFAYKNMV